MKVGLSLRNQGSNPRRERSRTRTEQRSISAERTSPKLSGLGMVSSLHFDRARPSHTEGRAA